MVSKTRDRLIEVARQLFARNGVENTTMLDIADAAEKGRRTIYTYFRNKREIHQAVIERESEQIVSRERQIQGSGMSAARKLEELLKARFEILRCPTTWRLSEPKTIRNLLDGHRAGKTRRLAAQKELEILSQILREGVANGEFDVAQASSMSVVIVMLMQGIDSPMAHDNLELLGFSKEMAYEKIIGFLVRGLLKNPPPDDTV